MDQLVHINHVDYKVDNEYRTKSRFYKIHDEVIQAATSSASCPDGLSRRKLEVRGMLKFQFSDLKISSDGDKRELYHGFETNGIEKDKIKFTLMSMNLKNLRMTWILRDSRTLHNLRRAILIKKSTNF